MQLLLLLSGESCQKAVEDVIVALILILRDDPGFLQKVLLDLGAFYHSTQVEVNVDILAEAG